MWCMDVFSIDDLIAELLDDDAYRVDPIVSYVNELDVGVFAGFESMMGDDNGV